MPLRALALPLLLACASTAWAASQDTTPANDGTTEPQSRQEPLTTSAPANVSVHALCETHANDVFSALDEADYAAAVAHFDARLRGRYAADQLKHDYEALPASYGKLLLRGRPHTGDVGGHTLVLTPLIFERGTLTAEVHCAGDGTVSDFKLAPTQVMTH